MKEQFNSQKDFRSSKAERISNEERHRLFVQEAEKTGLINQDGLLVFNLNAGPITADLDPSKVFKLVQLARKYAPSSLSGEHNALLKMHAYKDRLDAGEGVVWDSIATSKTISLETWLQNNGFNTQSLHE